MAKALLASLPKLQEKRVPRAAITVSSFEASHTHDRLFPFPGDPLMRQMLIFIVALGLLSSSSVAQFRLQDSPPPTPKLIKAGRILDVTSGKYILNQGILTEDERIKEVGPWEQVQSHAPKGVITIDLGQATVLPGLTDCHSHLLVSMPPQMSGGESLTTAVALMSPEFRTLLGAKHAKEYLEAGVTSVRVVGHSGIQGDIALRDAIKSGLVPGPRLQAAGRKLTPPGGQSIYLQPGLAKPILEQEYITVSGPEEARTAVRENIAIGADLIKIAIGPLGAGPFWKFRWMAPEDAKAITDEAHRQGVKVAAHATDKISVQSAIDAGVDSVEHAFEATDQQLQQMKDKGIFLVATDIPDNGGSMESKDRLQRAMKIGLKIAMGSDLWFPPGAGKTYGQAALQDLEALHEEGMSSLDVIRSATVNAAQLMGWSDFVGQIAPGKYADIIAVSADPLQDVTSLQHVGFVMKGASVVRNELTKN
jgi:imidazolonepropionase-like amidohydrolase